MAIYWHPFLTQFLRQDYGSLIAIENEVNLGDMPLRLDLLFIPRYSDIELPYPFYHLGPRTLASYKGPGDIAGQSSLVQLLTYALLYQQREDIWQRHDLTLWLLANEFADDISLPGGAQIDDMQEIGVGVRGGTLDDFPIFLIDLGVLPVSAATLPLVMAAKGENEQSLVEFLLDNHAEYASYIGYLIELHGDMLMEVLMMRQMTPEDIGLDKVSIMRQMTPEDIGLKLETLIKFLQFYSDEKVINALRRLYGDELILKVLTRRLGKERVVKELMQVIGEERSREIIEQLFPKRTNNNDD